MCRRRNKDMPRSESEFRQNRAKSWLPAICVCKEEKARDSRYDGAYCGHASIFYNHWHAQLRRFWDTDVPEEADNRIHQIQPWELLTHIFQNDFTLRWIKQTEQILANLNPCESFSFKMPVCSGWISSWPWRRSLESRRVSSAILTEIFSFLSIFGAGGDAENF